ncbi:hypothetical protein FG93_00111 [Bosea sp. LC85]|nr:hypothetical protein FG93_00111 [Bosea sp. LC85]
MGIPAPAEGELALDPDAEFASIPLQLPGIEAAPTQQAQVDAAVLGEVMRVWGMERVAR